MIDKIHIEKADFNDLEEILQIQKTAFLSEAQIYNDYTFDALTQSLESIQSDYSKYIYLKAVYNDEIVGSVKSCITDDNIGWIGRLIVKREYQNKGIAKKLLAAIEQTIPDVKEYLLFTGEKSLKNIYLYQSVGYSVTDRYADPDKTDLILVKMIKNNKNRII